MDWMKNEINRVNMEQRSAIPRFRDQVSSILERRSSRDLRTYTKLLRHKFEEKASKRDTLPDHKQKFLEAGRESALVG